MADEHAAESTNLERLRERPLRERLGRHRSRDHVSATHDLIDANRVDFAQHCFERWQVAVDVVERSYPHRTQSREAAGSLPRIRVR